MRLTCGGASQSQPLVVKMDPRVKVPRAALEQQAVFSRKLYDAIGRVYDALDRAGGLPAPGAGGRGGAGGSGGEASRSLRALHGRLLSLFEMLQDADVAPTTQVVRAVESVLKEAEAVSAK